MADKDDININIGVNPAPAESGSKRVKTAVGSVSKEAKDLQESFRRLKSAIDPTFAAQEKYNRSIADAKKLLQAHLITQKEYNAAKKLAANALDSEVAAINRRTAAGQAAAAKQRKELADQAAAAKAAAQAEVAAARQAAQEKIAAARAERREKQKLEEQERAAIKLAAQLARQSARDATRANRPITGRAVGKVEAGSINSSQSIGQLENNIARAQQKLARLTTEAEAAAVRAAQASTVKQAQMAEETARRRTAAAQETRDRIIQMEREIASQVGALAEEQAAAVKAAKAQEKLAAKQAAADAASSARERQKAEKDVARAAREAANAIEEQARAERVAAQATQELRASIDPAYAAQMRYNDVMSRATQLLMANKLKQGEWTQIQKQAKAQMDVNIRSMGRMNSVGIQLGYQMQDVAASVASGINPLVILAQQGGQTASALAQMGGTVGKVASILGGVWVQAGLAAVVVLSQLASGNEKAKKQTVDLTNAESIRTAKLPDLIEKIQDLNRELAESNRLEYEALKIKGQTVENSRIETQNRLNRAVARYNDLQRQKSYWERVGGNQGAVFELDRQMKKTQTTIDELRATLGSLASSADEVAFSQLTNAAEAMTDASKAAQQQYEKEQAGIKERFMLRNQVIRQAMIGASAEQLATALAKSRALATDEEAAALRRLDAAQKAANSSKKETTQETANYIMPAQGRVTSGFGARPAPLKPDGTRGSTNHGGIDIGVPVGTSVKAAQVGVVEAIGQDPKSGKYVILNHGAGVTTRYLHLSDTSGISKGQSVQQGEEIAKSGNTGGVRAHLHYEVRVNGKPVDPRKGIFPIDTLKAEAAGFKDLETAGQKAAREGAAAVEEQQKAIEANTDLSNQEQLAQLTELQNKKIAILAKGYGDESTQVKEARAQQYEITKRYNAMILADTVNRIRKEGQLAETQLAGKQGVEAEQLGMKSDEADYRGNSGITSERQALVEKAAILDQEYQMEQAHQEQMMQLKLSYLRRELTAANQTPERQREINNMIEQAEAESLARRMIAQAQHARKVAEINRQQAEVTMNKWREVTQSFTGSVGSAFQGLWTRSITVQQAFIQMADQMVYKFVDIGLRAAQQEAENWIRVHILKQTLKQQDVASTAAAEATKTGTVIAGTTAQTGAKVAAGATETTINTATAGAKVATEAIKTGAAVAGAAAQTTAAAGAGMTEIGTNAAVAAAGAYKSTVVIPFIGPVSAPAAAALALATVLGFGALISARGGQGEVGEDGQLSVLHKKEMVLPAKFAEPLRRGLTTRGSSLFSDAAAVGSTVRESVTNSRGGDNLNFNYQPKHTNMGADFDTLLKADGRTLRKWIKNEMRNGGLKLSK